MKKLFLSAALAALLSTTSLGVFADGLSVNSEVISYAYSLSTNDKDTAANTEDKESLTGIAVRPGLYVGYSVTENGWTAKAAWGLVFDARSIQKNLDNPGQDAASPDGNYYSSIGNDMFTIKLGNTRFLGNVANTGGFQWSPAVGGLLDFSFVDTPDNSSRLGNLSVAVTAVPNVTISVGYGMGSSSKTEVDELKNSKSEVGASVIYNNADMGLKTGVSFVSAETACEFNGGTGVCSDRGTENEGLKLKNSKSALLLGASYDLKNVAGVPLSLWAIYGAKTDTISDTYTVSGETVVKDGIVSGRGYNDVGFGVAYSDNGVGAGLSYESLTFEKGKTLEADGTEVENKDAPTGNMAILWVNYDIVKGTKAFFTYTAASSKVAEQEFVGSSFVVGMQNYF